MNKINNMGENKTDELISPDELMTISQYADYKKVCRPNVYYWVKKKYLEIVIIGGKTFIKKNSNPIKKWD